MERGFLQKHVVTGHPKGERVQTESKFGLGIIKKFFIVRLVRYWNKLPREALDASSLAVFKASLDGAFSNLSY